MISKKQPKKQYKYNFMVLNLLKELSKTPDARLSIREMSRVLKINAMAVQRAVEALKPVLDIKEGSDFESFRLPLKLIKLKETEVDLTLNEILNKAKMAVRIDKELFTR
ncbi:hypothetical protein KY331_06020 [Candidatus Woesearchaeota archaeon]|nr:hypothetical protein [Candidatus Woesearchaeota archaeon]